MLYFYVCIYVFLSVENSLHTLLLLGAGKVPTEPMTYGERDKHYAHFKRQAFLIDWGLYKRCISGGLEFPAKNVDLRNTNCAEYGKTTCTQADEEPGGQCCPSGCDCSMGKGCGFKL